MINASIVDRPRDGAPPQTSGRSRAAVLSLVLAFSVLGTAQNPASAVEGLITAKSLESTIRFLADDLLEGRGVGSRGDALSRLYLRTQFALFGLAPAGSDGSFEQEVPILGIKTELTGPVRATGPKGGATFAAPQDFTLSAGRPSPTSTWDEAEVVFVGYGITAKEESWDDFKDEDVRGKVLLVMNNDPENDPELFAGKTRLYYGRWSYKFEEAARRGALGAIVIHTTPSAGYPFHVIQAGHGQESFHLPFADDQPTTTLETWCSEAAAKTLVSLGGHDLDALRAKAESRDFRPVPLGVKITASTKNTVRDLKSANVLASIPGSDPALQDEYVVLTAHFDHLGVGPERKGDTIYNGALDNATGCAALINIARAVSAMNSRPRRSLLFAAVTAEESGLLGAKWFARHPTVPAKKMVANYNIDGINIWGETKDLSLVGYGKNSLTALAKSVAESRGRVLLPNPDVDKGLFYRSDHFAFAKIGVPSAYFKAGSDFTDNPEGRQKIQRMYTATYYHTPQDEIGKGWSLDGAALDVRLILECLLRTANDDSAPSWTPGDEFEKLR